MNGILLEKV